MNRQCPILGLFALLCSPLLGCGDEGACWYYEGDFAYCEETWEDDCHGDFWIEDEDCYDSW
ncbi:MAG: hypothetical protein AB1640_03375 [bacterium]